MYQEKLRNVRMTAQRKAILQVLEEMRGHHVTAEEVYLEVKKSMPGIGLATVYRTLELFSQMEILHKGSFDEGKHRFEFCEQHRHFHHHFLCLECGGIFEVKEDYLQLIEGELERKGYVVTDHALKIYGYCPECALAQNRKPAGLKSGSPKDS